MAREITTSYRNSTVRLWDSVDVSLLESDLLTAGVANVSGDDTDAKVVAAGTPDNTVRVKVGRVYVSGIDDGQEDSHTERVYVREERTLTVTANATGGVRVDAVIVRVDVDAEPDADADNVGTVQIIAGDGVTALDDSEIQTAIGDDAFYRLANIRVPDAFTTITNSVIDDMREPARVNLLALKSVISGENDYYVATGSSDTFEVTLNFPIIGGVLPTGLSFDFKANHQISGPADIVITDSRGVEFAAVDLVKEDGDALGSSDILDEMIVSVRFDGTDMYLTSPQRAAANTPLDAIYGDGSDGALNVTSGTTQIDCTAHVDGILVKQYTSFNVSAGATLEFTNVPNGGIVFVPLVQGNFTNDGTIDMIGDGSLGATGATYTGSNGGNNGASATEPYNAFGETRSGGGGTYDTDQGSAGSAESVCVSASGAGGSSNMSNIGTVGETASTPATGVPATSAAGGTVAAAMTLGILALVSSYVGIHISPGCGGASGGASCRSHNGTGGTLSATAGNGGRGGGSMMAFVGGDWSMTGTINLSGSAATASSVSLGTIGTPASQCAAAGGSCGGSSGVGIAIVKGTISNPGTYTLARGANGAQATNSSSAGAGGNFKLVDAGDAGNSAAGTFKVVPGALG